MQSIISFLLISNSLPLYLVRKLGVVGAFKIKYRQCIFRHQDIYIYILIFGEGIRFLTDLFPSCMVCFPFCMNRSNLRNKNSQNFTKIHVFARFVLCYYPVDVWLHNVNNPVLFDPFCMKITIQPKTIPPSALIWLRILLVSTHYSPRTRLFLLSICINSPFVTSSYFCMQNNYVCMNIYIISLD
uniref:Uncharacterized protein n=1 Tax=Cacopsylla melanoneura TaxID=428564 RepID=A0A8D8TDC5_9HEMI